MYRIYKTKSPSTIYWRKKERVRVFSANSNPLLKFSVTVWFLQLHDYAYPQLTLPPSLPALFNLGSWQQAGTVGTVSFYKSRKRTLPVMSTWHDSNVSFKIRIFNRKFKFNFTKYRYNITQCSKIMELKNNFKIFKALGSTINNAI